MINSSPKELSTARSPDLDWSQVRETVNMLYLAVAQMGRALDEGEESVTKLGDCFSSLMERSDKITRAVDSLSSEDDFLSIKNVISVESQHLSDEMLQAVISFQFYDKLSQRLGNVSNGLQQLSGLVSDNARLFNPNEWQQLHDSIRASYTMEEEKEMFDMLLNGYAIEEVLEMKKESIGEHDQVNDDIELF